jgi:hypothetical protein
VLVEEISFILGSILFSITYAFSKASFFDFEEYPKATYILELKFHHLLYSAPPLLSPCRVGPASLQPSRLPQLGSERYWRVGLKKIWIKKVTTFRSGDLLTSDKLFNALNSLNIKVDSSLPSQFDWSLKEIFRKVLSYAPTKYKIGGI